MDSKKLSTNKIHKQLTNTGYLCDKPFAAKVTSTLFTRPTSGGFLFGPAGTGKSFLPKSLAEVMGAEEVFYQCFPGTREDDLLVKMLPDEETTSGIKLFDGPILRAIHMSNNGDGETPVFLTLDEWDKTRPSADSFLLDFLQNGRVTFQGDEHVANLDRLFVYVTMNDERDLSEPLLRRLPLIEFDHLEPELVYEALKMTHAESEYLDNAIMLYERCVMADMTKPATIQELRQLLDAIEMLGDDADWDTLVYQFITKTQENHMLLKLAEDKQVSFERKKKKESDKLKTGAYEAGEEESSKLQNRNGKAKKSSMPKMSNIKQFDIDWDGVPQAEDEITFGILHRNSDEYDRIVHMISEPNEHAGNLGSDDDLLVANVSDDDIRLVKPIPLTFYYKVRELFNTKGEIMFIEPAAKYKDIKRLSKHSELEIVKYAKDEVIAKANGIHLRCTPDEGAEIIVDLDYFDNFANIFGASSNSPDSWLGGNKDADDIENAVIISPNDYGIMYRRHYLRGIEGFNKALIKNRYNIWGDGWDEKDTADVPLLKEFLENEDFRVLRSGSSDDDFYLVDNIVFGFFGDNNDMFGLKILGQIEKKYYKYIERWIPEEGIEVRFGEKISTDVRRDDLVKKLDFTLDEDNGSNAFKKELDSGLAVVYHSDSKKLSMFADLAKKDISFKKLNAVITDMENTWGEFYNG